MAIGHGLPFMAVVVPQPACPTIAMPALATSSTAGLKARRVGAAHTCTWAAVGEGVMVAHTSPTTR